MGRYTQRRRAASGPAISSTPPPPVGAAIVSVVNTSFGTVHVTFDQPITFSSQSNYPELQVDGNAAMSGFQSGADVVQLDGIPAGALPGAAWVLGSQPAWILETVLVPQSGTVA